MFLKRVSKVVLNGTQKRTNKVNAFKTLQEYEKNTASHISHNFEDVTNGPSVFDNKRTIIFQDKDGHRTKVSGYVGQSLTEVAKNNGIPLYDECHGGEWPACISCHVIIPEEFHNALIAPTYDESLSMKDAPGFSKNSRLGCQIMIDELTPEGMVVSIPDRVKSYTVEAWCRQ